MIKSLSPTTRKGAPKGLYPPTVGDYYFASAGSTPLADQGMDAAIAALIAATGAAGTCTLPAGIVTVNNAIALPATFQGKTLQGHASGTTIVRGVQIPTEHIRGLSINDAWYYRFPESVRDQIKCVDINALGIDPGGWPDTNGKHDGDSFSETSSTARPMAVQVGTQALEFAQERGSTLMGTNAWRVVTGVGSVANKKPRFSTATMPAEATDVRLIMTDDNDYNPKNWAVSSIDAPNNEFTLTGTTAIDIVSGKQRAKIINAPEYLTYEGAMVISFARGKLYYIPPTGQSALLISNCDDYVLTMTDPINMEDSGVYAASWARRMTVKNLRFAACGGSHIHNQTANWAVYDNCDFEGSAAHSVRISNAEGVAFTNGCTWKRLRKTPILQTEQRRTRAASPATGTFDTGPFGARDSGQNIIPGVTARFIITAFAMDGCRIEDMSLLYPASSALAIGKDYQLVGGSMATPWLGGGETVPWIVDNNVFKNLSGAAIRNNAFNHTISNNLFQDCCLEVTDAGCIMSGRTLLSGGTLLNLNGYKNITQKHTTLMSDDVAGVMLDDGCFGYKIIRDFFDNCDIGILSNGGRGHQFDRCVYKDCSTRIRAASASVATAQKIVGHLLIIGRAAITLGVDPYTTQTAFNALVSGNTIFPDDIVNISDSYSFAMSGDWSVTCTQGEKDSITDFASITDTGSSIYMLNWVEYHMEAADIQGTTPGTAVRWIGAGPQTGYDSYDSGDGAGAEGTPAFE